MDRYSCLVPQKPAVPAGGSACSRVSVFFFFFFFNVQVLKTASHRETDGGVHSSVQFTVTSDITAFCNVSNEFGADAVTFDIKTSEFPVSALPRSGYTRSSLRVPPPTSFSSVLGLVQRLFMFQRSLSGCLERCLVLSGLTLDSGFKLCGC